MEALRNLYGTFVGKANNNQNGQEGLREIRVAHPFFDEHGTPIPGPTFCNNSVFTAKYNAITFVPRSLFEQFRRLANLYFLGISILMIIGTYSTYFDSPLTPWTTLIPLIIVLAVTMGKEGMEDLKRHKSDAQVNSRPALRLGSSGQFETVPWSTVAVGDLIKVLDKNEMPCDMILLASSEHGGVAFVETAGIDGETNLKIKLAAKTSGHGSTWTTAEELHGIQLTVQCELPNPSIHFFNGTLSFAGNEIALDQANLMLRGSSIRNTKWIVGVCVYTGRETKIVMNAREPPSKLSTIERTMNTLIYLIFGGQCLLSTISLIAFIIFKDLNYSKLYYVCYDYWDAPYAIYRDGCESSDSYSDAGYWFTFFILYNNFIPISLYVTVECVNYIQASYIDSDLAMYDIKSDTPALARTSNMNGDLGQIEYVFSDKTGTLTQNVMNFKRSSISGQVYGDTPAAMAESIPEGREHKAIAGRPLTEMASEAVASARSQPLPHMRSAYADFMLINSVCHTVQIDADTGEFQAESPDEEALVKAALEFGYKFSGRQPGKLTVLIGDTMPETYEILAVIPFDSTRKRMSSLVRKIDETGKQVGSVIMLIKGADSVIFERTTSYAGGSSREVLESHLEVFAADGLRTLLLAKRVLTDEQYRDWAQKWHEAETAVVDRDARKEAAAAEIEINLTVVGATAIEDKLQDDVPNAIADLHKAGIKLWVLTGDKMETAINIGYACRLLRPDMVLIKLQMKDDDPTSIRHQLQSLVNHFTKITADSTFMSKVWSNVKRRFAKKRKPEVTTSDSKGDPLLTSFVETPPSTPELGRVTSDHMAFIVDGATLNFVLGDLELETMLLTIAKICNAVIACRVSPAQKRMLVALVKHGVTPKPITLAIGDGANDVGMIQEAQIGVGISGKEGRQAVNNSDFAIAQFRFLKNLLLVHGRWNYRRICKVVLYSFYKNIVLTLILFYFTFRSGMSGESLFEDYVYAGYNFFLFLPVVAVGIFDKDVSSSFIMKYPQLYISGLESMDMNVPLMLKYFAQAIVDSVLLYTVPSAAFQLPKEQWSQDGYADGLFIFGTSVYTYLLLTMLIKIANMTYTWNWISVAFWVFSLALYFFFICVYQLVPEYAYNFTYVANMLLSQNIVWMLMLIIPSILWALDLSLMMFKTLFHPTIVDAGIEWDRGFRPSTDFMHPEGAPESTTKPVEEPLGFTHDTGLLFERPRFTLDWGSVKAMSEAMSAAEKNEMGMTDTSEQQMGSSFVFDFPTFGYGPGAGGARRAAKKSPAAPAPESKGVGESKGPAEKKGDGL